MKARKLWGFVGFATLFAAQPLWAAPDVTIEVEEPASEDWDVQLLFNNSGQSLPAPSLSDESVIATLNGPYVRGVFPVAAQACGENLYCWGNAYYTVFYTGQSYEPAAEGAISGIEVSVQMKAAEPVMLPDAPAHEHPHPSGVNVYLALRQDGVTYWRRPLVLTETWTAAQDQQGDWDLGGDEISLEDEFVHFEDPAPVLGGPPEDGGPNFVDGGPIEVGLLFSTASNIPAHSTANDWHNLIIERRFAFDDFEVVFHRADIDADGYNDGDDNCVAIPNGDGAIVPQCDTDEDGYGNACDGDFDNNWSVVPSDYTTFLADYKSGVDSGVGTDMDCNGSVVPADYGLFVDSYQSGHPGPSGLACAGTVPCDL